MTAFATAQATGSARLRSPLLALLATVAIHPTRRSGLASPSVTLPGRYRHSQVRSSVEVSLRTPATLNELTGRSRRANLLRNDRPGAWELRLFTGPVGAYEHLITGVEVRDKIREVEEHAND